MLLQHFNNNASGINIGNTIHETNFRVLSVGIMDRILWKWPNGLIATNFYD